MCKLLQHLSQSPFKATGERTARSTRLINYLRGGLYRVNVNSGKKVMFREETRGKMRKANIMRRVVIIAAQIEYEQEKMLV
jgi:hypothetical protein